MYGRLERRSRRGGEEGGGRGGDNSSMIFWGSCGSSYSGGRVRGRRCRYLQGQFPCGCVWSRSSWGCLTWSTRGMKVLRDLVSVDEGGEVVARSEGVEEPDPRDVGRC